jgi:hypothetical protein
MAQIGENLALIRNARLERHRARSALARIRTLVGDASDRVLAGPFAPGTPVHIVSPFENAYAGTEMHAIEIAKLLAPVADVTLWATQADIPPALAAKGVVPIAANQGRFPQEGLLVIFGSWQAPPAWLAKSRPARIVVVHNVDDTAPLLDLVIGLRAASTLAVELLMPAESFHRRTGLPGTSYPSPIDIARFAPRASDDDRNGFVVGRLSRNHHLKFHPDDPDVMRRMIEAGMRVRVMGGDPSCTVTFRQPRLRKASSSCRPAAKTRGRSCARSTLSSTARARCGPRWRAASSPKRWRRDCRACARTTWDSRSSSRTASTASCFLPTTTTQRSAICARCATTSTCAMRWAAPRVRAWRALSVRASPSA